MESTFESNVDHRDIRIKQGLVLVLNIVTINDVSCWTQPVTMVTQTLRLYGQRADDAVKYLRGIKNTESLSHTIFIQQECGGWHGGCKCNVSS